MLFQLNLSLYNSLKSSWLPPLENCTSDFPKEYYLRQIDYLNPSVEKSALSVDYALLDSNQQVIATMAISHVGPKTPKCYIKITDIFISPALAVLVETPISFVEVMTKLLFSVFRLSEGELFAPKIKVYGSTEQARIFFETMQVAHLRMQEEGYLSHLGVDKQGNWLELTKLSQECE